MKTLFRWAFRLCLLLLVLLVAGVLLLDTVAREFAEYQLGRRTGLEVKIGKLNVGLLNPRLTFEHLVIYNSAEFGGSPLLDLPELHVEYDRGALLSHGFHGRLVRLNLAQINVVEAKDGRLNLGALQQRLDHTGGVVLATNRSSGGYAFLGVDALNLTLQGRANFLSMKNPAQVDTLKLDLRNRIITGIKSSADLQNDAYNVLTLVLLKNGVNPVVAGATNAAGHWDHWLDRLKLLEKP